MSAAIVQIASLARKTSGTVYPTIPILLARTTGDGSERVGSGRPAILTVTRDRDGTNGALEGTVAVYGVNLPHSECGDATKVQVFKGVDGATGKTIFDPTLADMPYVAWSNNNWIVLINGAVVEQGSGAGKFQVSNPSTTQARFTFGTALADNDRLEIYKVTPAALLADAANVFSRTQIISKTLVWLLGTVATNLSATQAILEAAGL